MAEVLLNAFEARGLAYGSRPESRDVVRRRWFDRALAGTAIYLALVDRDLSRGRMLQARARLETARNELSIAIANLKAIERRRVL